MKKIALLTTVELKKNGVSEVIFNSIEYLLSSSEFDVTLIYSGEADEKYLLKANKQNLKLIAVADRKKDTRLYFKNLKKVMKNNDFDLIHMHCNNALSFMDLTILKRYKNKVIVHAHQDNTDHPIIHSLMKPFFNIFSNERIAVSDRVAKLVFYRNFIELKNPVKFGEFKFDEKLRESIRNQLNIENEKLFLSIGRIEPQKNYLFEIDVFKELYSLSPSSKLLIIGNGSESKLIKQKIKELHLENNIILLDNVDYPSEYYSAADAFLLTSIHEALGLVLIEAQISGLPTFSSDVVSNSVSISENLYLLSLKDNPDDWARLILQNIHTVSTRINVNLTEKAEDYKFENSGQRLLEVYRKVLN